VYQVAGTETLLCGAGLLGRSFARIVQVDPGFDPDGLIELAVTPPASRYRTGAERREHLDRIEARVASLPGVVAISRTCCLPPDAGVTWDEAGVQVEGRSEPVIGSNVDVQWVMADESYRTVLGIELLRGRDATPLDGPDYNVLVTESFARRFGGLDQAVGAVFRFGDDGTRHHVTGVVENVKLNGPLSPYRDEGILYLSQDAPDFGITSSFAIRTNGSVSALIGEIRRSIAILDPDQPIAQLRPVSDGLWQSSARPRFFLVLIGAFSVVATVLAAIGLYGLLAFLVGTRRREIGVRVALGAGAAGVRALILAGGLKLTAVGLAVGVVAVGATSRILEPLLFETSTTDPVALGSAGALLLSVAAAASYFPARSATRVDPVEVLRDE
jgi:predicted permease